MLTGNASIIRKCIACIFLCLLSGVAPCAGVAELNIGAITGPGWKIEGVRFSAEELFKQPSAIILQASKLTFAKPFHDLQFADIRCEQFTLKANEADCRKGRAAVRSAYWQSPSARFSFHLGKTESRLTVQDGRFAGGDLSMKAEKKGKDWQVNFELGPVDQSVLKQWLPQTNTEELSSLKQGKMKIRGSLTGKGSELAKATLSLRASGISGQTSDAKLAVENVGLSAELFATKRGKLWFWQTESEVSNGAIYADPVYVEVKDRPITLFAKGTAGSDFKDAEIQTLTFNHAEVATVSGTASVAFKDRFIVKAADLSLQSESPQGVLTTYLSPFFTGEPFASTQVSGHVSAKIKLVQQTLTEASLNFAHLNLTDDQRKWRLQDGNGDLNWSQYPTQTRYSQLNWQSLSLKGLTIAAGALRFESRGNAFALSDKVRLPLLNGTLAIDTFSWRAKPGDEPDVSFAGNLDSLSLEQLTQSLGWTPLTGNISGQIPGVEYHNKVLSLGGELSINVFDGTIKISQLKSSGLFSGFPRLESEIELDHLDLEQLTAKFEFGAITGRLSGFVKNLVLENWRPLSFYAWFGTPDNDNSSHRISQKAVKNIASIGGGGASDILSRGFLSFFETFRYDQIGMGCYLHDGACQLMGLEAKGEGYYLIKGGWLPRIDVVGYNPRVNWDVLVERLKRVAAPEQAIVK